MSIPETESLQQDKLENHNGNIIRYAIVLSKADKSEYVNFNVVQYLELEVLYWRHHRKIFRFLCCQKKSSSVEQTWNLVCEQAKVFLQVSIKR